MRSERQSAVARESMNVLLARRRARARLVMAAFQSVPGLPALPESIIGGGRSYAVRDGMFQMPGTSGGRSLVTVSPYRWVAGHREVSRAVSEAVIHAGLLWILGLLQAGRARGAQHAILALRTFEQFLADEWRWIDKRGAPLEAAEISEDLVWAFRQYAVRTRGASSKDAAAMRWFYRWAIGRGLPGFTRETLSSLTGLRLGGDGLKGAIARHGHPRKGALDEYEQRQLVRSIHDPAHGADPRDRALVWLCWELGIRPVQLEALRWRHLEQPAVGARWIVRVPRAKDPTSLLTRTMRRTIPAALGELLVSLRPEGASPNDCIVGWLPDYSFAGWLRDRMKAWARLHGLVTIRPWKDEMPAGTLEDVAPGGTRREIPYWALPLYAC